MVGATETAAASKSSTRDVQAEEAALSLARRRGKCAPSVDTKLTDAWLGFYVALTKCSGKSLESTTQASTEVATEASLSDAGSSGDPSPRREKDTQTRRATIVSSATESWADASEEVLPKKRTRRSRRRRTRGRGKRNRKASQGVDAEDDDDADEQDCDPIDEEDATPETPRNQSSTTVPAAAMSRLVPATPPPVLPAPVIMPSGLASTGLSTPTHRGAILPVEASPISSGLIVSTSPSAVHAPAVLEASARTPPKHGVAFASSPVARMMPSTPTAFGSLTYQGGHAEYKGSHMMMATSPSSPWMGTPSVQAPSFFGSIAAAPQVTSVMDPMRSWLAGGTAATDAELAMRLLAAAPETYED